jgi:large subunit ribosomal protein L6
MSRIGKQPIQIPDGVTVAIDETKIAVSGQKGSLEQPLLPGLKVSVADNNISIERHNDEPISRSRHGLMRSLIYNMVFGVNQGYEKKLELNGVGYRVQQQGADLKLNLGFSHEITYNVPTNVEVSVEQNVIIVRGFSKQQVGQVAAEIRALKKPEPYKGKGIKYQDERIIRKSGKSGKE